MLCTKSYHFSIMYVSYVDRNLSHICLYQPLRTAATGSGSVSDVMMYAASLVCFHM